MIAYLSGTIIYQSPLIKKDNFLVIDCQGVGYKVFVLDRVLSQFKVSDKITLHIYTQIAENVMDLYGFLSREELDFFELLLTIPGIGPRSAMDILRKAKIEDLIKGVESGDFQLLAKISGIGPKTAEKIVLGLKNKLNDNYTTEINSNWNNHFSEALEALTSLGYSVAQAREALNQSQAIDLEGKLKEALKLLSKK